jgi:signal transduction histidine kinase
VELVREIERRYPTDPESTRGAYHVARTREPLFIEKIPDELLAEAARDEEHLALIRSLQLRSYICVPIATREQVLAVLTLAMAESGRIYGPRDLELATTLADRAGLAMNHARLFAEATDSRAEAERANRAKDEFLAMLGHELRNPLAPMLTALHLMKLRAPGAMDRERQILERQLQHVVALVDDLLDVSRITSGKIELAREPVDLSDTLVKALEITLPLLEQRRHEVITDVPKASFVTGDPVRLAQVLSNLIANAAKYTEPGGRVQIRGWREDDRMIVEVEDDGVGISPELLPRVFERFAQGSQSIDRAQGGLGLGLTIVRSVVELHGGRASARSDGPGRGSTFRVELPALDPAGVTDTTASEPPRDTPSSRMTILVVDDNQDARELLEEALALSGYDVHTAADPASAIERAEKLKPAVALLDIGLPVMDGYELARRLRAIEGLSGLRLVAITGYGQPGDKDRAREAGFDEHLVKPVSLEAVRRVLERLAGSPS